MGQTTATGSAQLFVGRIVSSVILAVGTIILGLFILDSDYGLYSVALIPATTLILFQDWGVGSAITRYSAKCRSEDNTGALRKIIVSGFFFELATGIVLTVLGVLTAALLASNVFGKPESGFLIMLASVTILSSALGVVPSGVFVGFEKMHIPSWLLVFLALIQGIAAPVLVYIGYGALGAVIAYTAGAVLTGVLSIVFMYFSIYRKLPHSKFALSDIRLTLKPLLSYGVPLALGNIINGLAVQLVAVMMASFATTEMLGNNKVAGNFGILLSFVTIPVATVLLPAFSKIDPRKEKQTFQIVFAASVKYTSLLLIPATLALIVLSEPIIGTIYGDKWLFSPLFLALGSLTNLLVLLGSQSVPSLLSATGDTKLLMKMYLLFLVTTIPIGFVLIPSFGVTGALITGLVASLPKTFIGLYYVWKNYGIKISLGSSSKILLAGSIPTIIVYASLSILDVGYLLKLVVGGILFLAIYLCAAPLVGAVNKSELNTLRDMFSNIRIFSKLVNIPIKLMEAILSLASLARRKK